MELAYKRILPGTGHDEGRHLLAQLYRETAGQPLPQILTEQRGKPYFAEGGWHFSISHTKEHVFCVLSRQPVGVDAEELTRQVKPSLARSILSETEYAQYEKAPDKNRALLTFWVLKEAAGKATGEGIRIYPNHTSFSLEDPRVQELDGCLVAVIEGEKEDAV